MSGKNSFYDEDELAGLGLKSFGENVLISRKASIYSPERIEIGSHVRIDDFCILSGRIVLGNYIHISAYSALYAALGIEMGDYSGLSPRVTVFSASDDFNGEFMIGPMLPHELTNVSGGKVRIEKFVQVGAGSIVLPGLHLKEGSVTGSMSLVTRDMEEWMIYTGIPAKPYKPRSRNAKLLANNVRVSN